MDKIFIIMRKFVMVQIFRKYVGPSDQSGYSAAERAEIGRGVKQVLSQLSLQQNSGFKHCLNSGPREG